VLSAVTEVVRMGEQSPVETTARVEKLLAACRQSAAEQRSDSPSGGDTVPLVRLRDRAVGALDTRRVHFDAGIVKQNLDDIALMAAVLGPEGVYGKELLEAMTRAFGHPLSPGTVYPVLHELNDDELFQQDQSGKSKSYTVLDEAAVAPRLQDAASQHLVLGTMLERAARDPSTATGERQTNSPAEDD
jgi:hypothetical protein